MSQTIDTIRTLGTLIVALQENKDTQQEWHQQLSIKIEEFESTYAELEKDAQKNAAAANNMNALAKGIPAFSKGVMSAVEGFKRNDPLAGSAGVIDSVSSIITTVASMSSAAGPAGAIIGAILSVVSMIMKLFSAQKPAKSLTQQLDEVIRNYDSEKYIQRLKSLQVLIENFVETTPSAAHRTRSYLEAVEVFTAKVPEPRQRIMDTAEWLKEPKNQELELWSAVLAAQCFAYIAYTQSLMTALSLIETEADREKFRIDFIPALSDTLLDYLREILPVVRNRGTVWQCTHAGYLHKRDVVVSTQQSSWTECGAAKELNYRMQSFTVANRPRQAHQSASSANPRLAMFSIEGDHERIKHFRNFLNGGINPNSQLGSIIKKYRFRGRFGKAPFSKKYGIALQPVVNGAIQDWNIFPSMYSVSAMAGKKAHKVMVYTSHGEKLLFWEHGTATHSPNEAQQLHKTGEFLMYDGYLMGKVNAVFPRQHPKEASAPTLFDGNSISAVYGACEVQAGKSKIINHNTISRNARMEIRGFFMDHRFPNNPFRPYHQGVFTSPWSDFLGIATDPHYLWVYRAGAIACTTHTDILAAVKYNWATPNWMVYQVPHHGIHTKPYDPEKTVGGEGNNEIPRGIIDLAACTDGTLTAIFTHSQPQADGKIFTNIYSMTPKIDLAARTLKIEGTRTDDQEHTVPTSGWVTDRSTSTAYRVVKQPVFCWEVVNALLQSLEEIK